MEATIGHRVKVCYSFCSCLHALACAAFTLLLEARKLRLVCLISVQVRYLCICVQTSVSALLPLRVDLLLLG